LHAGRRSRGAGARPSLLLKVTPARLFRGGGRDFVMEDSTDGMMTSSI
jgi:hypothetical protein